ncbi:hypothetical protein MVES1_000313 [Malassezia vespertilionis]|uniref:Uncharacterized protein n=1 Tax=Malassezia vespertilionis TaxID=2020962 RepID=A0A2N1JH15_9BASI|nr:uncharacterized protein MVES1_000313 [Malassezia vespertilionis]PKI85828.1 hypothetical protein MVES_000294 [Malassezia vespertilionis]WFD04988.1 hypothetical protein MVES1_000313 [Malassezia vespertilionis]
MSRTLEPSAVGTVPMLEAKASFDLKTAAERKQRAQRNADKPTTRPHPYYWLDKPNTLQLGPTAPAEPNSASAHSRTPSNPLTSCTNETMETKATTPQRVPATSSPTLLRMQMSQTPMARAPERPSHLDISALSPEEYATFSKWIVRIKPAHTRRHGYLDEHAAIKFLRNELGVSVDDEITIMSMFERLPLGLAPGHFYAMVRLASWAQQGYPISKELLFTQTTPPQSRRRRRSQASRTASGISAVDNAPKHQSHALLPPMEPILMEVPKAPPRQVSDEDTLDDPPLALSSPRVVRPKPVLARPSNPASEAAEGELSRRASEDAGPSRYSEKLPESPMPFGARLERPSAPLLLPLVSPLIQAGLNARSEVKRLSRQASRPKTFTVLSSSSGQVPRAKPRLLTGQEAPLPRVQPQSTKRRSINRFPSILSDVRLPCNDALDTLSLPGQTIAPRPSYVSREHNILPAWLREQQFEGNVAYVPPDANTSLSQSVFESFDDVHESMSGSERAAASINRNTPFFPPHERDLERLARADMEGCGPAHYRALNAQISGDARSEKLSRPKPSVSRRRVDPAWGTLLDAGTYAGFKLTPSGRDLRLLTPRKDVGGKRALPLMPPNQEFQPMLAPPSMQRAESISSETRERIEPVSHALPPNQPQHRASDSNVRYTTEQTWTPRMQPTVRNTDMQRFTLQGDATRPQLPHLPTHDRKSSGSYGTMFKTWPKHETQPTDKALAAHEAKAVNKALRRNVLPVPSAEDEDKEWSLLEEEKPSDVADAADADQASDAAAVHRTSPTP